MRFYFTYSKVKTDTYECDFNFQAVGTVFAEKLRFFEYRRENLIASLTYYYFLYRNLVQVDFQVESRPRSGRLGSRSVEVGQVEKNRPTYKTSIIFFVIVIRQTFIANFLNFWHNLQLGKLKIENMHKNVERSQYFPISLKDKERCYKSQMIDMGSNF